MLSPLIIGPEEKEKIKRLINLAKDYEKPYKAVLKLIKEGVPKGYNDVFTIKLETCYMVTYTHEELKEGVMCRHISVRVTNKGRCPHPLAVNMILEEFGFINPNIYECHTYIEDLEDNEKAINVVEPLDGDMSKIVKRG